MSCLVGPGYMEGARLVNREHERLGDVHMCWAAGRPDDLFGDVVGRERLNAVVYLIRGILVAIVSHETELGLDQTGLHIGHADRRADKLLHECVSEGAHSELGGTVLR